MEKISIIWFRQDLRLADNPALFEACKSNKILPIYIYDDKNQGEFEIGEAKKVWLHHSLSSLNEDLSNNLSFFKGSPKTIIEELIVEFKIENVFWNRCYQPWQIKRDQQIKEFLNNKDINCESFNGSLLWEPWKVLKNDGTPFKVFTPYYKNGCLVNIEPRKPLDKPTLPKMVKSNKSSNINGLNLLPSLKWNSTIEEVWSFGEKKANEKLDYFLENGLNNYKKGRDFPASDFVSKLSPHLHHGEISPNQAWHAAKNKSESDDCYHFCSELGWREFSYYLLYHFPDLPNKNLQKKFDNFQWDKNKVLLEAWQKGQTGYPIIDAGMRQLYKTGWMHNRVRMIVGSFLVKNLLLHWHHGRDWFWDCLVDADLASNSAGWQWIAGCGADAAPYFRIFNPITQSQKFDPEGEYIREFVPEIKNLPNKFLFEPYEAPEGILKTHGIKLGETYPYPIVNLKESRLKALDTFALLKKA